MKVLKQVLGRQVQFGGNETSEKLLEGVAEPLRPVVTRIVDFRIIEQENREGEDELPYRFEWRSQDAQEGDKGDATRWGWLWAESIEDTEDMGHQYFGIEAEDWSVPYP